MPEQEKAAKPAYYAQFDGDEVEGKFYKLGDPIDEKVPAGTIEYLKSIGRIAVTKPAAASVVVPADLALEDMSREQLEATARSMIDLSSYDDDQLRSEIGRRRALIEEERREELARNGQESQDEPTDEEKAAADRKAAYEALKNRPLAELKTDELKLVAEVEGVDLTDASNNEKRVAAIQAKRDAA